MKCASDGALHFCESCFDFYVEGALLLSWSPLSAVRSMGTSAPFNSCTANSQV